MQEPETDQLSAFHAVLLYVRVQQNVGVQYVQLGPVTGGEGMMKSCRRTPECNLRRGRPAFATLRLSLFARAKAKPTRPALSCPVLACKARDQFGAVPP
jgi:hypothetical protein